MVHGKSYRIVGSSVSPGTWLCVTWLLHCGACSSATECGIVTKYKMLACLKLCCADSGKINKPRLWCQIVSLGIRDTARKAQSGFSFSSLLLSSFFLFLPVLRNFGPRTCHTGLCCSPSSIALISQRTVVEATVRKDLSEVLGMAGRGGENLYYVISTARADASGSNQKEKDFAVGRAPVRSCLPL